MGLPREGLSCAPRGLHEQGLPRVLLRTWLFMKPSHCRQASSRAGGRQGPVGRSPPGGSPRPTSQMQPRGWAAGQPGESVAPVVEADGGNPE